jgi:GNAT superfamily N-acetyltransferase
MFNVAWCGGPGSGGALTVRAARLEDLKHVGELERLVWRGLCAPHEELRRRFRLFPRGLLLGVAATEILGFCFGLLTNEDASTAPLDESFPPRHVPRGRNFFVYGLTVDPVCRRRGIGRRLVEAELELALKLGCGKAQLVANALSKPLVEQLGFGAVRAVTELFTAHRDLMPEPVLMEKRLL